MTDEELRDRFKLDDDPELAAECRRLVELRPGRPNEEPIRHYMDGYQFLVFARWAREDGNNILAQLFADHGAAKIGAAAAALRLSPAELPG